MLDFILILMSEQSVMAVEASKSSNKAVIEVDNH